MKDNLSIESNGSEWERGTVFENKKRAQNNADLSQAIKEIEREKDNNQQNQSDVENAPHKPENSSEVLLMDCLKKQAEKQDK